MDRVISLLAALVGLIALGGAILVHTNGDMQRNEMASQIAQLKVSVDLLTQQTAGGRMAPPPTQVSMPSAEPPISEYVAAEEPNSPSSSEPSTAARRRRASVRRVPSSAAPRCTPAAMPR